MLMDVAVVILNWNGRKLLEEFLPSVIRYSQNAEIYVADNCSSDDSITFLKTSYPQVKIIQTGSNLGYAGGYNVAVRHLKEKYLVLLNSDVEVTADWLTPVIGLMEKDSSIGACQPKIRDYRNKSRFEYAGAAGGFLDTFGYPFCQGRIFDYLEEDKGQYDKEREIFWATGACIFVRNDAFVRTGGFDEDFFAHMEEIDFCWRLKNNGYKVYYCPGSEVYHLGGGTLNKINPRKTYLNFRNNLLMLLKNLSGTDLIRFLFIKMLLDGIAGLKFLSEGKFSHFAAILQAHFYCYGHLSEISRKRKSIRKVSLRNTRGVYHHSIVYAYFIKKIRSADNLL
jgi:GT2 family glycosyltransferase